MLLMVMFITTTKSLFAAQAIETLFENQVNWQADGTIDATYFQAEAIGGVTGNYWPDLSHYDSIGQSFRCDGPILAAVQLGLADFDLGYVGLNPEGPVPQITVQLHRGGVDGQIVASQVYPAGQAPRDLKLMVNQPSDATVFWYLKIIADPQEGKPSRLALNATWNDSYPGGTMYVNDRVSHGDLHMRVHRQVSVQTTRAGKVILWAAPIERRIWLEPDRTIDLMLHDDGKSPVTLTAAGREWISTQWIATPAPGFDMHKVSVSIDPFKGDHGNRIDTGSCRIEQLRYLQNFKRGKTSGFLYPDPLSPQDTANMQAYPSEMARANSSFVVSVQVPDQQPAGVYHSQITFTINDGLTVSRPITLQVYDFSLPHQTHTSTGLFTDLSSNPLDQHLAMVDDLASFRITQGMPFQWNETTLLRRHEFSEEGYAQTRGPVMQESLIQTIKLLHDRGLKVTSVVTPWADSYRWYRNQEPELAWKHMQAFWETFYPILKDQGVLDEVYARMIDEVKGDELPRVRELANMYRQYAPQIRLMVTAIGTPDRELLSRAIGIADIWSPSSRYFARAIDFYKERISAGEEVWPYIHDHAFLQTDSAGPRLFFWMIQRYGAQGATYFSIRRATVKHTWFGLEQHTDTWAGDGDLYFNPPDDSNQPLWHSIRLHMIRDGIEDREYFWLMNHLLDQLKPYGGADKQSSEYVTKANQSLQNMVWGLTSFDHNPDHLQAARHDAAMAVQALSRQLKTHTD
jgi:hypothetical protein